MKHKYLFRLGRGKRVFDFLGPSISYFWNDIYDLFDIYNELTVKKLDRTEFTESEIRKIAGEFFEDMDEDRYLIGTEIKSKELHFYSLGTYNAFDLDECQQLVENYYDSLDELKSVDISESRELFFRRIDGALVGVLMLEYFGNEKGAPKSLIEKFRKDCDKNNASERLIVTDNEIENSVKKLTDILDMQIKSTDQMRREMNKSLLERALDEYRAEAQLKKSGGRFNLNRFNVLLDYVKNARTNIAKKRSLEDLAEYLLNNMKGFEVISRNPRGPSEEVDLIIANESKNEFFRRLGNPLLVECRHRKKPANSKDIRDFSGKLSSMAIKTGVLFSLKGVTGDKYDAQSALRDAKKEGKDIIVLDTNDLLQISQGANPIAVIRNAFYRFV